MDRSAKRMLQWALALLIGSVLLVLLPVYLSQSTELERLSKVEAQLRLDLEKAIDDEESMIQLRAMANTPEFIERIARDELGLVHPNEIIFSQID